jgi:hypothetical protein
MTEDDEREAGGPNSSVRLTYLLVGGGIGAIIALLLAPKPGYELRKEIADSTRKGIDRSREAARRLSDKASEYYDGGHGAAAPIDPPEAMGGLPGDEDFPEPGEGTA